MVQIMSFLALAVSKAAKSHLRFYDCLSEILFWHKVRPVKTIIGSKRRSVNRTSAFFRIDSPVSTLDFAAPSRDERNVGNGVGVMSFRANRAGSTNPPPFTHKDRSPNSVG
jgi:hypothetical protein